MPYLGSLDIANQALKLLGQTPIETVDEVSLKNRETAEAYDRLLAVELRRNFWKFAKRSVYLRPIDTSTMKLAPRAWDETVTYLPGSIVKDTNGVLWTTDVEDNKNNEPGVTTAWEQYFGPLSVHLYSEDDAPYYSGELVWKQGANPGSFVIFRSLQNENEDVPSTASAWDTTVLYELNDRVSHSGSQWRSIIVANKGITPADAPLAYDASAIYAIGNTVVASDGFIYTSLTNGNQGNSPLTSGSNWSNSGVPAAWSREPELYPASGKWLPVFSDMKNLNFFYPMGSGPFTQRGTLNAFLLPSGYLRHYTPDRKNPRRIQHDWDIGDGHIISGQASLFLTFVASVFDVTKFDPMFCEGLACRIALACCEVITQSTGKLNSIGTQYNTFMKEARMTNAVEDDYEEPPEDDLLLERL